MRIDLLVNDFTFRAFHDGFIVLFESNFKRNYIHVRDISRVFQHCLINFNTMKENVFNVGLSTANISKLELCKKIKEQVKKTLSFLRRKLDQIRIKEIILFLIKNLKPQDSLLNTLLKVVSAN